MKFKLFRRVAYKIKSLFNNSYYAYYIKHRKVNKSLVIIESKNGNDFVGNMLSIARELDKNGIYNVNKIRVPAKRAHMQHIKNTIKLQGLETIEIILWGSNSYYKTLATAGTILTDFSLNRKYIKRDGQVLVNTWHGTPLKTLGRHNKAGMCLFGFEQKIMLSSDYLVYPNRFMKEKMFESYCLDKLYEGTILYTGYPRNSVFFDEKQSEDMKASLNVADKQVIVYMPTWRGSVGSIKMEEQESFVATLCEELDRHLDEHQILYVKFHNLVHIGLDYTNYKHIREFPVDMEPYHVLNMADVLVTDYSSVMFDFANTQKKIILYTYDLEEYIQERGFYFSINELPFPLVTQVQELITEINKGKNYDDQKFLDMFCTYDNINASQLLCEHVFSGKKDGLFEYHKSISKKLLVYAGKMDMENTIPALCGLLNGFKHTEYTPVVCIYDNAMKKDYDRIEVIDNSIPIFSLGDSIQYTSFEYICELLITRFHMGIKSLQKILEEAYKRDYLRQYNVIEFDGIINIYEVINRNRNAVLQQTYLPFATVIRSPLNLQSSKYKKNNRLYFRKSLENSDKLILCGENLRQECIKFGVPPNKLVVSTECYDSSRLCAYNGSHPELSAENLLNSEDIEIYNQWEVFKKKIVVYMNDEFENLQTIYHACQEQLKQNSDIGILIYGFGEEVLMEFEKNNDFESNIILCENLRNPIPFIKNSSLYIMANDKIMYPYILYDVCALGVPIVSIKTKTLQPYIEKHGMHSIDLDKKNIELLFENFSLSGDIRATTVTSFAKENQKIVSDIIGVLL